MDAIKNYSTEKESFKKLEFMSAKDQEIRETLNKLDTINKKIDYDKLLCVHTSGTPYNLGIFKKLLIWVALQ